MLQIISPNESKIILDSINPEKNVALVNEHIKLSNCKNMTVDITGLNIMDACMVSTLCSAQHYIKYPNGKINWITNSKEVSELTADMILGNSEYTVAE